MNIHVHQIRIKNSLWSSCELSNDNVSEYKSRLMKWYFIETMTQCVQQNQNS